MALYRAPRIFEQVFNLENFVDVNALQSFIGYARLSAVNVFERTTTFLSEVIVTARLTVTDLNVINTFLGYEINIFGGIKAPIQAQLDGIIAGGTYTSTISIADTVTLPSGESAEVENLGTSTNAYLQFSIPQGIQGPVGGTGAQGNIGATGATGAVGAVGLKGEIGYTGPVGATGETGKVGPTGATGATGLSGKDGAASSTGATGCTGSTGPTGERGPAGNAASTGATGATGHTGPKGLQGERGGDGSAGAAGEKGPTGPRGEKGETGKKGDSGADGNSTESNIASFFALGATIAAVGTAMAAYMLTTGALDALEKAGYATVIWVNSKVSFFTSVGVIYTGSQKCAASLTLQNGIIGNTVLLSNSTVTNSYFENTVDFKKSITVFGTISNSGSASLDIKATGNDLNMTSTNAAINLYSATQIALNAPNVINSGDLKVNSLKQIAAADDLNIGHNNIVCSPTTVLKVNTISEMYDNLGVPSNLTITNPKLIVNNKLCCNALTYINATNSVLDISHSVVNVLGILKTNEITSLRDADDLLDPTVLEIKHEIVKIPESLKVDRLRSLVDPVVGQTQPSELNINHDLVRIEEILLVNKIETAYSTEQLEANPTLKTKLEITHEEVKIPNLTYLTNLKTDTINPFSDTVTIPPTESILTIAHNSVLIPNQLKVDEITSLQEPDDMINPTQLQIKHEVVKIPELLKVDRIGSVITPPTTVPPTETSITISHNNVIIQNNLQVDKIIPNTVPYPANPYTELVISHNYVEVSEILQTNSIRSITNTIGVEGKFINLLAPAKTNVLDPDSEINITADRSSVRGKTIYIGNPDGSSEIHIIGNCHFYNTQNENAFWNEVDGFFQQNGI